MSGKKQRNRARRRAERLIDDAFAAIAGGEKQLAKKLSERAVDEGRVNPRLWFDRGRILRECEDSEGAEAAFHAAVRLAPKFSEAWLALAKVIADAGRSPRSILRSAVEHCPDDTELRAELARFEPEDAAGADEPCAAPAYTERTERYDWTAIDRQLLATGGAKLPGLCTPAECERLASLWQDEDLFEHEIDNHSDRHGRVTYRFFARPLPELVASLREEVYRRAATIANGWNRMLGRRERFPNGLSGFLRECERAGQRRTTPILLRYDTGGFNAPHRDIAGRVYFPLQLAVTLGPATSADQGGGEFRLVDQRLGKKQRESRIPTAVGDGVLFCTRDRLCKVGGVYGLQPVAHGVTEVGGLRFAVGIPFHEHR